MWNIIKYSSDIILMDKNFASFDFSEDISISAQLTRNIKASKSNDSNNSKSGKWSKEEV